MYLSECAKAADNRDDDEDQDTCEHQQRRDHQLGGDLLAPALRRVLVFGPGFLVQIAQKTHDLGVTLGVVLHDRRSQLRGVRIVAAADKAGIRFDRIDIVLHIHGNTLHFQIQRCRVTFRNQIPRLCDLKTGYGQQRKL